MSGANALPTVADATLATMVRRLVHAYQPERAYLFGSRARGEVGPHSDYDILLVVPDHADRERRRSGLVYRVLWDLGTATDVVVMTRSYFAQRCHLRASLPGVVAAEGALLSAA